MEEQEKGMMMQAIVIMLKKDRKIEAARKKYSKYHKFRPHISLVYPFRNINQKKLYKHIKNSIKDIKKFKIILRGLKKSARDYYLYLLVDNGKKQVMQLYRNLNLGILTGFENKDMLRYIPHLTLGVFNSKEEIDNAQIQINKKKLICEDVADSIQLLTLNQNYSIKHIKNFKLK